MTWSSKLPAQSSRHILAIDGTNIVRRAWHACVNDKNREPKRAAPTAIRSLARIIRARQASHLVIGGEGRGSVRASLFAGYKADRPPKPDGLLACEAQVEAALSSVGVQVVKVAGLEADDVLAGAVLLGRAERLPVVLVSNDNDIEQLVNDVADVTLWDGFERVLDEQAVLERWGVAPRRLGELFALTGQKGDGIPGAPGIGKARAVETLAAIRHRTLVDLLELPNLIAVWVPEKHRKKMFEHRSTIALSYDLVRLRGDSARTHLDLEDAHVDARHVAIELGHIADRIARAA